MQNYFDAGAKALHAKEIQYLQFSVSKARRGHREKVAPSPRGLGVKPPLLSHLYYPPCDNPTTACPTKPYAWYHFQNPFDPQAAYKSKSWQKKKSKLHNMEIKSVSHPYATNKVHAECHDIAFEFTNRNSFRTFQLELPKLWCQKSQGVTFPKKTTLSTPKVQEDYQKSKGPFFPNTTALSAHGIWKSWNPRKKTRMQIHHTRNVARVLVSRKRILTLFENVFNRFS